MKIMMLAQFNVLSKEAAAEKLFSCCGSKAWVANLMRHFPFADETALVHTATTAWYDECTKEDWLEAFTHHPKIGDLKSLHQKFAATKKVAGAEQAGMTNADESLLQQFAIANSEYEEKFGFIFIVCATGKPAEEMFRLIQDRLKNDSEEELVIAMGEQHKITIIRLQKLLTEGDWSFLKISQLTTHVLDTSIGKPAKNITIRLQQQNKVWQTFAQGVTDKDGRITNLLPPARLLTAGIYKIVFETEGYFNAYKTESFYPTVEVLFTVKDDPHYHVPLLLNPFGYSTYRGS
jgi:5-hydroxyisourate hydrolase/2-oxo-4-hydroxy-4-carboxy-5-ureidoimidazoline decarboxylase